VLVYWHKERIKGHYIFEVKIHRFPGSDENQEGIRYRAVFIDLLTGRRVLMDNHHPKGHHLHLDETEMPYEYRGEEFLIEDFTGIVFEHMGVKL